ncbi:hypothetical protein D3C83_180650 [compost metagenome]
MSASAKPMYAEPSICPSTSTGCSARPQSCAIQIFSTRTMPVSMSTSTSATCAVNEYAGEAPIVPPRYSPCTSLGVL